jgi:hypothetical protein
VGIESRKRSESRRKQGIRNTLGDHLTKLESRIGEINGFGPEAYVQSCKDDDTVSQKLVDEIAEFVAQNIGRAESALFQSMTGFKYSEHAGITRRKNHSHCRARKSARLGRGLRLDMIGGQTSKFWITGQPN